MISDPPSARVGRQVEMEGETREEGREVVTLRPEEALLQNAHAFLRSVANRAGILDFNGL